MGNGVNLIIMVLILVEKSDQKIDLTHKDYVKTLIPEVQIVRRKRENCDIENIHVKVVKLGDWLVELNSESNLFLFRRLKTEWFNSNNSYSEREPKKCDYHKGFIKGLETESKAAVTLCGTFIWGYLDVGNGIYFFEPLNENTREHIVYKSKSHNILKRTTNMATNRVKFNPTQWVFNLTGDIIDIENTEENLPEMEEITLLELEQQKYKVNSTRNQDAEIDWSWRNYSSGAQEENKHPLIIEEYENGYFYDTTWTTNMIEGQKFSTGSTLSPRWMEIAVAVDHTLISFHGRERVEEYVLSLLNIVSAIYQDPSLESNMKLVVTRLILYENRKYSNKVIKMGSAKRSLENVNSWNKALHASISSDEPRHDLAIWLTRSDIGGPSGYAPVAGVCDPKRSCALNRDEGLTSGFIIAHETAHILGLSHDGDKKNNNDCSDEALDGSVMAPMVSATFNKFYWSQCSKKEFKKYRNKWLCLLNPPTKPREMLLNATLQASFTMDQQCRMEFGDGYTMCRTFEIIEPCSHLWCGHVNSPLVCKTKKGSPLEGTECGFGKWCVNGYCEDFANRRIERMPIVLNPQDGQWTNWSFWGPCSRTCGTGAQFRTRKCENPPPSFGGKYCEGKEEEWRLCKISECAEPIIDIRALQCKNLPKTLNLAFVDMNFTWHPYESDESAKKCKLICLNTNKKELFFTNENLVDGTPCSYDDEDNICVQGICQYVGCDGVLHSQLQRDTCGVCGGDNSQCTDIKKINKKRLKKEYSRIFVMPEKSREVKVELNATKYHSDNPILAFVLKNRRKKTFTVLIPDNVVRSKIMEGSKFYYKRYNNIYKVWAKGPIQNEMVVLITVLKTELKKGINVSYSTQLYIHKTYLIPSKRFVWIIGGWGACSSSCDGGRQQRTAACYDNSINKIVKRTKCALMQKPKLDFKTCNTFSCHFKWMAGEWEPCTTSCGTIGVQHREIYCLSNSILDEANSTVIQPWRYMVNPSRCGNNKPSILRSCNRKPCFSYWTFGNWTQCSATCGHGFQSRSSHCLPPKDETFYTCGNAPSPQRQSCFGPYNKFNNPICRGRKRQICQQDKSECCSLDLLHKYCKIGGFKRMCCHSCKLSFNL